MRGAKRNVPARLKDSTAREGARDLLNVLLRVAAVNAERVQFHQLARVVLVDAATHALLLRGTLCVLALRPLRLLLPRHLLLAARARFGVAHAPRAEEAAPKHRARAVRVVHLASHLPAVDLRVGRHALEVVEVEEHRGALRRRLQEVSEVAERVRAYHVAVVRGQEPAIRALLRVDVEVVRPEVDHHLLQLPLAVNRPNDSRRVKLRDETLRRFEPVLAHVLRDGLTVRATLRVCGVLLFVVAVARAAGAWPFRAHGFGDYLLGICVWGVRRGVVLHRLILRRRALLRLLSLLHERGKLRRQIPFALKSSKELVRLRVLGEQLGVRHAERRQSLEPRFERGVVNL